jgi:putative tryptophan/tyrosine transport system substrate-binding protein
VEFPPRLQLVVNMKAATALGITIPAILLARADEIIE